MRPTQHYPHNPPRNQQSSQITSTSWTKRRKGQGGKNGQKRLQRRYLDSGCPKKRHFKTVKQFIHQEDTITLNEHAPKSRASTDVKQKMTELEGKTDGSTSVFGDVRAPCQGVKPVDRRRARARGLLGLHTMFDPTPRNSSTDRMFSKTERIPGASINTSKLKNENYTN